MLVIRLIATGKIDAFTISRIWVKNWLRKIENWRDGMVLEIKYFIEFYFENRLNFLNLI